MRTGDVEGALSLYEREAAFVPEPGTTLTGRTAIRAALEGFAALEPKIDGEITKTIEADGIALVVNHWWLAGKAPDGAPVAMKGVSTDVMRRQPDGAWKILVDDPWGGAA
jgi:uncharacterized protein (TIGR02246 family)